jgi:hypothetical protein
MALTNLHRVLSHLCLILSLCILLFPREFDITSETAVMGLGRVRRYKKPSYYSLGFCDLPASALEAPKTFSHTPSALPSLRAAPMGELDAVLTTSRAARLVRETTQCNQTFSNSLLNATPRLLPCDDFSRAMREGRRASIDAPFDLKGCRGVWFTPSEACDMIEAQDRMILFVGDSLLRQMLQSLFVILSGHYTSGGVPMMAVKASDNNNVTARVRLPNMECACEAGFAYHCREKTFADWFGPLHWICPKWGQRRYIHPILHYVNSGDFSANWNSIVNALDWGEQIFSGTTLVLNIALHNYLDAEELAEKVYGPLFTQLANATYRVRVICFLMPAPEEAKRKAVHLAAQGTRAVIEYNAKMRRFCTDRGATVFESFAVTKNATTSDGLHFPFATNVLLAQLLLNLIGQGEGWQAAVHALGDDFL